VSEPTPLRRGDPAATASDAIDVLCSAPAELSPVQLDRFLFSLVLQSHPLLYVTIVLEAAALREAERAAETFDWSGLPRPPAFVAQPGGPHDARARRTFALAQATRRFAGVVDMRGTLYTRAFELLAKGLRGSKAAVTFGDSIIKDMRAFPSFTYEAQRHYLGAWSSGVLQLQAGWLPPLAACLLDLDKIARRDLLGRDGDGSDEAVVFRLLSRYPARPIEERVPVYARDRLLPLVDEARPRLRRGVTDPIVLAARELRRRTAG
jgi:hypothetical protein